MPFFQHLAIMPKESKTPINTQAAAAAPYRTSTSTSTTTRSAGVWKNEDDAILLQARAAGLNWVPIAKKYFPEKSGNACRKRHERLQERRQVEDWDNEKLELLAQEYMAVREEMWEILASRLGAKWQLVEQKVSNDQITNANEPDSQACKCMEKGLKTLHQKDRDAQRKGGARLTGSFDDQAVIPDHEGDPGLIDSGIHLGSGSEGEMEVDDDPARPSSKSSSWHAHTGSNPTHQDHVRSRSLPQPLPLYQPPPAPVAAPRRAFDAPMTTSPATLSFTRSTAYHRYSPEARNGRRGLSVQSILSPIEPGLA